MFGIAFRGSFSLPVPSLMVFQAGRIKTITAAAAHSTLHYTSLALPVPQTENDLYHIKNLGLNNQSSGSIWLDY